MSKSGRLLAILNLIRTHHSITADRLAEKCGVSERTIYRDLATLCDVGAPVYFDNGYKLLPGFFLPPLNLSVDEYLTFKVALLGSPLKSLKSQSVNINNLIAKIDNAVNSHVPEQLKRSRPTQQIAVRNTTDNRAADLTIRLLQKAVDNHSVINFRYASVSSGTALREVNPYFVVFRGRAWYLLAYCRRHREVRTFRVDRISRINFTDKHFDPDPSVSPDSYFKSSWEVFTGKPVRVKIRFRGKAAAVISTGQRHPDETIKRRSDKSIDYSVSVAGIEEISRWIVGFGGMATVIEPPQLLQRVKKMA
ncbi:MAG: YafY family protein, partial [Candidatus Zixiibacteriota bacterium]